jgi:hypothetical protein
MTVARDRRLACASDEAVLDAAAAPGEVVGKGAGCRPAGSCFERAARGTATIAARSEGTLCWVVKGTPSAQNVGAYPLIPHPTLRAPSIGTVTK